LRRFPGPKLSAISYIPYGRLYLSGEAHKGILKLHQTYGPIVRVAPHILSVNHPNGMKELRGHRKTGTGENGKDPVQFQANSTNIIGANREDHQRFRRALAHGFSSQAMLDQQPIIRKYVDTLFEKLHLECDGGSKALDIVKWFNWTTFDVIGDLSFGEPFGCLEESEYHPWVSLVFIGIKSLAFGVVTRRLPLLAPLLKRLTPKSVVNKYREHNQLSQAKTRKRLEFGTERPDLMDSMLKRLDAKGNVSLLILDIGFTVVTEALT
jgi:cytochrome P450